jgi:hypothetical protein
LGGGNDSGSGGGIVVVVVMGMYILTFRLLDRIQEDKDSKVNDSIF